MTLAGVALGSVECEPHGLERLGIGLRAWEQVPVRVRQLFMRHSDIRLTMQTYDDSALQDMEEAIRALEKLLRSSE